MVAPKKIETKEAPAEARMEVTAKSVERLVTVEARWGFRGDRGIVVPLYESACSKLDSKSPSLVAAQRMTEEIKSGDRVLLVTGFAAYPRFPYGETDGPLGVASLARAISFGLGALPVLVTGPQDMEVVRSTVKAAGLNVMEYGRAKGTSSAVAAEVIFPCVDKDESKKVAANILDECAPKALISVETVGPNKKGIKHTGGGAAAESKDKFPGLEYLFYEANARGVLSVGCIDQGNEIGSGTIEEAVRIITPYGDICNCPCRAGLACVVKTDIVFPTAVSNWGAYAMTAMVAYLLEKPEVLQDPDTERRMLEACIMAGALEGMSGRLIMGVDGLDVETNQSLINILHSIIRNALFDVRKGRYIA